MIRRTSLALVLASTLAWGCSPAGGEDDRRSLSSAQPELAGENCPAGGQKILTGLDLNGDGLLEASEVQQVAYVCNRQSPATCTTLEGDITIRNPFDWANLILAGCTRITGTLAIAAPGVTSLGAPSPLVQVGRLEVVNNDTLTSLRFPALTTLVDGAILADLPSLTELQLPALARVGTSGLDVTRAPKLAAIDLPALAILEGSLGLYQNPKVARVNLPALTTAGWVTIGDTACASIPLPSLTTASGLGLTANPRLTEVDLPVLNWAYVLDVSDDPALVRLRAPALTTVSSLWALRDPVLAELSLPALAEASFDVGLQDLPALTSLELPALRFAGFLMVDNAAALASLDLPALTDAWYVTVRFTPPATGGGAPPAAQALAAIALPALASVSGALTVSGTARVEALALPALASVGMLAIDGNAALGALSLPSLGSVSEALSITENPLLPQCQADAVVARLQPPLPARVAVTGNGGVASCQ